MSDLKQVKVDNWGIYFLQRLKHFFNRTDYCDLTLQFQDNAQLKVHRLVLNACTEYFELLERTCEMYEDCLVMPDDLQADVVVPIINFMYTGQLEFKIELFEKIYQTSQIMSMPVLSKLLDAQRQAPKSTKLPAAHSYSGIKHYAKGAPGKQKGPMPSTSSSKRSFTKAFDSEITRDKRINKASLSSTNNGRPFRPPSPEDTINHLLPKRYSEGEPRPTRYELPEELDTDNIYENSFSDISYTSTPLMVHPDTTKRYSKRVSFGTPSSSKMFSQGPSTVEIVECKKIAKEENVFDDDDNMLDETDLFGRGPLTQDLPVKNTNQLFDQIIDDNQGPKVTIEAKNSKQASKLDHAKIISEVLKKYPHLVKSNKNIKLKLLDTPSKPTRKRALTPQLPKEDLKLKSEADFTYETEVLDSVKAAKLIAAGAENIKGPWICLICGTPGRALHFTSYYKFRRHLVEIHNEKPVSNMCEYCGLKSLKRNYLLHHLYTKHGKKPPPQYNFPKCNLCSYIALNEGYLVKHRMTHAESRNFRCNVCAAAFNSSSMLLMHIQNTGHKYSAERKTNLQCVYCLRVFLRESNLYAHLKTNHKLEAKTDCIIDDSDEDKPEEDPVERIDRKPIKYEIPISYEQESEDDISYQVQQKPLGNLDLVDRPKKHRAVSSTPRQKILNSGFGAPIQTPAQTPQKKPKLQKLENQFLKDDSLALSNNSQDEIIMIGETEYIMRENQLIPKDSKISDNDQYILSDMLNADVDQTMHTLTSDTTLEFSNMHHNHELSRPEIKLNRKPTMNQPIQIVVSNEEEYKALMTSNHSIIFDDPDTRKRLTVLSAPHDSTLDGAALDLDTAQSNEMMIIQDDFPLNVSEAVSGDDSNIVVVYSHPVGDQTKPYQLITSQALGGAQFVSTSAVLTRNYETVTTSATVVNTQIIDNQVTWHNNLGQAIEDQQVRVSPESELQVLTNVEEVVMAPLGNEISNNKLEELPEVHLLPEEQKDQTHQQSVIGQIEDTHQNKNPAAENSVEEIEDVSIIPMEDMPVQVTEHPETLAMASVESIVETVQAENNNATNLSHQEHEIQDQETHEQASTEGVDSIEKINDALEEPVNEEGNGQNINEPIKEVCETLESPEQEITAGESVINDNTSFTPVTKEQITELASEWSEDDDDEIAQSEDIVNEKTDNAATEIDNAENNSVELEESVENIEQEMKKQMTRIVAIEAIEECGSPTQEDIQTVQEIHEDVTAVPACPEKITSLLNDWDENDSRGGDENDSQEGAENERDISEMAATTIDAESCIVTEIEETTVEKEQAPKKDDKIKRLVSDWDDDDDDDGTKE